MRQNVAKLFAENRDAAYLVLYPTDRFYLTGFESDLGAVLLTPTQSVFYVDGRYSEDAALKCKEFTVVDASPAQSRALIADRLKEEGISALYLENRTLRYEEYRRLEQDFAEFELRPLDGRLEALRAVKSEEELNKIRSAQSIAERAFERVCDSLKNGMSERDVAVELDYQMMRAGAESTSFATIVAFDENASKPHCVPSHERKLKNNTVILIDFGAKFQGYCSDTTRTFWYGGRPTEEFLKIHGLVGRAVENFERLAKPGMTCREADALTRELIAANGYGAQFLHSTGHGVGLDIHEFPAVSMRSDTVLEEGMVITCEPGIYLPGAFGVRTEDLLVVRADGVESLTTLAKNSVR